MLKNFLISFMVCTLCFLPNKAKSEENEEPGKFRVAVSELVISRSINDKNAAAIRNSSLLTDIENAIRNGRKFEVLSRRTSALEAVRAEQEFAKTDYSSNDAAEEGELKNAQALIQIEVLQYGFGYSGTKLPNVDKYRGATHASLELSVQIIDTKTAAIKSSFPVKISSSSGYAITNGRGGADRSVMYSVFKKAASAVASQLSSTVFPMQIIAVKGKNIWVNRGDDSGIKIGELYDVFEPGEDLIDPATGDHLGNTELEVGRAKVSRILPKTTVLELQKGVDPSLVQRGFILRKSAAKR